MMKNMMAIGGIAIIKRDKNIKLLSIKAMKKRLKDKWKKEGHVGCDKSIVSS